jgi:hypothetical protein
LSKKRQDRRALSPKEGAVRQTLLEVLDLVRRKSWWGEPIDRWHLELIAKAIDRRIPPPGSPERKRYVLELANYLVGAVAGVPPDPERVDQIPD